MDRKLPWCFFSTSYQTLVYLQHNSKYRRITPTHTLNPPPHPPPPQKILSSTLWECERLQQSGLLFRVCLLIYCEALHLFTPVVLADPLMPPPSVVCCCAESQKVHVSSSVCFCLCPLHTHDEPACSLTLH